MKIDSIQFEHLCEARLDGLAELEALCFSVPWSRQAFAGELKNPVAAYIVAVAGDIVVGYIGVWRVADEGQITNVAVRPGYRRQGIGRALVERVVAECGGDAVTLEVRRSNVAAQRLYEGMGFAVCGERKRYYEGAEDALIMTRSKS